MKFYCDQCQTKYAIGDDKVQGKILKVRCKKCGYVITVKEPTTPMSSVGEESSSAASSVSQATSIQWYYALNGQTQGPYEDHVLCGMYERGEIGDGTYVWNESFADGWKLATDTEPFAASIKKSQRVRPKHKTIGVSAALQAIKVEEAALELDAQQGVAPASAAAGAPREDDFAKRLGDLRSKLQEKPAEPVKPVEAAKPAATLAKPVELATKPEPVKAAEPVKPVEAAKPSALKLNLPKKPDAAEEGPTLPMRSPEPAAKPKLSFPIQEEQPAETREVARDELAAMLGAEMGLDASDLPPVSKPSDDLGFGSFSASPAPSFGRGPADDLPSFGEIDAGGSSIDFSKLRSNDEPNPFAEAPIGANAGQYEASNSLLIQMDQIKKQGRGSRFLIGAAAVALIGGLTGVAVTMSIQNGQAKPAEPAVVSAPQKKELVIKGYTAEERSIFVELAGEDVITKEDVAAADSASKPPENPTAKPADKLTGKSPIDDKALAVNTQPKTKPTNDLLRGTQINISAGPSLEEAMANSKKADGSNSGLSTSGKDASGKVIGAKIDDAKPATSGTDWSKMKGTERNVGSTGPRIQDPNLIGAKADAFAGTGFSQEDAKAGFEKVKNSVASCRQRQVSRGLPTEAVKIAVVLEISPDGSVTDYKLDPPSMQHTEFDICMQSHTGRWGFKSFEGKPVKIRRTYVLQ